MPYVSKAQAGAMHAAEEGRSTIGIPQSVGKKFVAHSKGQSLKGLPQHVKKRKRFAVGGVADEAQGGWWQRDQSEPVQGQGLVPGQSGGREDAVRVSVQGGSYVIPADVVSALGQGNTQSGGAKLDRLLNERGGFADGGATPSGALVPVRLSGGEYVVDPAHVTQLGQGDLDYGHDILDAFIARTRKEHVKTIKTLPKPVRD